MTDEPPLYGLPLESRFADFLEGPLTYAQASRRMGFPTTLTESEMADPSPIEMDPGKMTDLDRGRLAAKRLAEGLLPVVGVSASVPKKFTPRGVTAAFQMGQSIQTVWQAATYYAPDGDKETFYPLMVRLDAAGRLHCEDGPSMTFSDGFETFHIHGIEVGRQVIVAPHEIPVEMIQACKNVEQRRVIIKRYGQQRYMEKLGLKPVHRDDWGELYKAPVPGDEDLTMVKVVNNTPEKDGTYKDYWLPVPPSMKTAKEAVAWTWAKPEQEFNPTERS